MPGSEAPAGVILSQHMPQPRVVASVTRDIALALLDEPRDPMRHDMDDESMLELQASIRESGLLQSLCVIPIFDGERVPAYIATDAELENHIARGGRFRVAAGHRRLLACRAVRHDPARCEVFVDPAIHEELIMHEENSKREEPSDYDLAVLYAKWLREPDITEKEVCRRAGKKIDFIYRHAEILNGYKQVADALHAKKISFTVATRLNGWEEPEYVVHWLNMAIDQGATSKIVSGWIAERKAFLALAVPANPVSGVSTPIHTQTFIRQECLLCGDVQSYNLQTVLMCSADIERIKAIRANAEQGEASDATKTAGS